MLDQPSASSASSLRTAVSSLKEVHNSASTLNEDMRELLEQVEIVEKLPDSTNLAQIDGWRSSDLFVFNCPGTETNDFRMSGYFQGQEYTSFEEEENITSLEPVLKSLKSKATGSFTAGFPYDTKFVRALLKDVHVMAIGDSLMRGIYKDLLVMLHGGELIDDSSLKAKTENQFFGDRQIDFLPLEKDRVFRQAREYHTNYFLIQYLFTTRIMKDDIDTALLELCSANEFPDVILINSCLWDMTRYSRAFDQDVPPHINRQAGVERAALEEFLERVSMLIRRLRLIMPPTTQVIWINMPWPIPSDMRSILNRVDNSDTRYLNRMMIVDANYRASQLFRAAGYDVLDINFYMRNQALYAYRVKDGCSDCIGTRIMTQLVIGHLARSWNIPLPARIKDKLAKLFYEALRRDICTMRLFTLLEDNPEIEKHLELEDNWKLEEMVADFPNVAEFIGGVVPQEITVVVDEGAVDKAKTRKRKHSPDRL
ncbi:hypothetical protein OSTOST_07565 [Ostertagia ostertagi]